MLYNCFIGYCLEIYMNLFILYLLFIEYSSNYWLVKRKIS